MTKLTLPSPAKLNLFLHINGRLDNGYHELQSLFHFLDYGDTLDFELLEGHGQIRLSCNDKSLETPDNLIIRAAKLLQTQTERLLPSVNIHLNKVLPMGGGVGGGSSNCATTLLALNTLWQLDLSNQQLRELGNQLGADVPIFVFGQSSIADGTGEKLTPFVVDEKWYLVLTPNAHVNTALLFNHPDLPRDTAKIPFDDIVFDGIGDGYKNDFEQIVVKNYPEIAKARQWLLEYAPSRMTGTGACIFAMFDSEQSARAIFEQLPEGLTGFVAKGTNQSTTHHELFRVN